MMVSEKKEDSKERGRKKIMKNMIMVPGRKRKMQKTEKRERGNKNESGGAEGGGSRR